MEDDERNIKSWFVPFYIETNILSFNCVIVFYCYRRIPTVIRSQDELSERKSVQRSSSNDKQQSLVSGSKRNRGDSTRRGNGTPPPPPGSSSTTTSGDGAARSATSHEDAKNSFHNKLMKVLFSNINRGIDELYQQCDDDDGIVRCKEAIELLDRGARDFAKLIERIEEQGRFEQVYFDINN